MNQFNLKYNSILLVVALVVWPAYAQVNHQTQVKGKMGSGMRGEGNMQDMQTIHELFAAHKKITRIVRNINKGVETITESDDPKVQALIKEHVAAMYQRLASNQPIRKWDPLFAEIFKHADQIKMQVVITPKGIRVIETSDIAYVVKLIQAHAAGVSEFVQEGMTSMHKTHPLPDDKPTAQSFRGKGDGVMTCPVTGEPVDKNISANINGKVVYFCCANCRDEALKNPGLFLNLNSSEKNMQVLNLQPNIQAGKDKQVDVLFEGANRKIVQITLRNNAVLEAHKAAEPITIQCITGKGTIKLSETGETVKLTPGVLLTIEPNVLHELKAEPVLSILLSRFTVK